MAKSTGKSPVRFTGWKKRYSYLDDYKRGMDGKYVYYGRHYIFEGTQQELRRYKWILGITDLLLAALFVVGGCLDAGAIWNSWFVILPFMLEAISIFLLLWKTITLMMEKSPVKAYLYKKTVPWFKPCGVILIIACLLSFCMALLCLLLNPELVHLVPCIFYLVIKLVMAGIGYVFLRLTGKASWILDPSEEPEETEA